MSRRHPGIPLLSGPPPSHDGPSQSECRKCGREFNLFFHRQRKCMHCGYGYCSSCSDYQALMPRRGPSHGYDPTHVCAYCVDMLNITALSRTQLRSLPIAKLSRYISAYNIPVRNPIDKNDLVDAAVAARTHQGCLLLINEEYYRKHSVPSFAAPSPSSANRSASARGFPSTNANNSSRPNRPFPRPDLDPNRRDRPQEHPYSSHAPRSAPNVPRSRTTSAPMNPGSARSNGGQPNIPRPTSSAGQHPASRSTSTAPHSASPMPPPPMSTLVTLSRSALSALSVGTLKQILWETRVRLPPGVVEKDEIVERVWAIVEEERRKDNEGIDDASFEMDEYAMDNLDGEEEAVLDMVDPGWEAHSHEHEEGHDPHATTDGTEHDHVEDVSEVLDGLHYSAPMSPGHPASSRSNTPQLSTSPQSSSSPSHSARKPKPRPNPKAVSAERSGLCVVCQDEEACIAVVDCGHLAMCRECSDLVLASSRECPLCRTRIVTEARLLRIFKT